MRLDRFHQMLGATMGWQDSHLHVFERGSDRYGFPDPDLSIRDDRKVTLRALLTQPGDRLLYEYDFGDSWEHEIVLEAVEQGGHSQHAPTVRVDARPRTSAESPAMRIFGACSPPRTTTPPALATLQQARRSRATVSPIQLVVGSGAEQRPQPEEQLSRDPKPRARPRRVGC